MLQLVKLQEMYGEFEKRDTVVLAIANEEQTLAANVKIRDHLGGDPHFLNAVDLGFSSRDRFERTTSYLVDKEGVVRQVFPMEVYQRAPWWALLKEVDKL